MLIVSGDPLQEYPKLQKIDTLVFNGRIVNRKYPPWPSDPFMDIGDVIFGNPPVESLNWVMTLKKAMAVLPQQPRGEGDGGREEKGGMPGPVASPPPAIETISPTVVTEESPTTITMKGFNFVRRVQIYFNARSVPYEGVNSTELGVMREESMLRTPGNVRSRGQESTSHDDMGMGQWNFKHRAPTCEFQIP